MHQYGNTAGVGGGEGAATHLGHTCEDTGEYSAQNAGQGHKRCETVTLITVHLFKGILFCYYVP